MVYLFCDSGVIALTDMPMTPSLSSVVAGAVVAVFAMSQFSVSSMPSVNAEPVKLPILNCTWDSAVASFLLLPS